MTKKITAWSYSRYSYYKECPYKLKLSAIDKVKVDTPYAFIRGRKLHSLCENYLNGKIRGMPLELKPFEIELKTIKRMKATPEADLSVNKDWAPSFGTDWDNVWCRSYLDAVVLSKSKDVLAIIDYKTGRIYTEAHMKQAHLYATCAFGHYPDVQTINVEFWYFDQDETLELEFSRNDWKKMKAKWNKRVHNLLTDTKFMPNPSVLNCKYCFYNPKKGGPCKYAI